MDKINQFIADIKETISILEMAFCGFIIFFCIMHFSIGVDTRSSVKPALIIGFIWGLIAWVSQFLPDDIARRDLLEMWKKRKKK
jgi:hypothetical protein